MTELSEIERKLIESVGVVSRPTNNPFPRYAAWIVVFVIIGASAAFLIK